MYASKLVVVFFIHPFSGILYPSVSSFLRVFHCLHCNCKLKLRNVAHNNSGFCNFITVIFIYFSFGRFAIVADDVEMLAFTDLWVNFDTKLGQW